METGINIINQKPDKESLEAITVSIISILGQPGDQETIRHALSVLRDTAGINSVNISDCKLDARTINVDPIE